MKLNLDKLSKQNAENKIDEVIKSKINLFQYHEILVWALENQKDKDIFYATCYFAEEVLEVTKEDILAMPIDDFAFIYEERKGYFGLGIKYLDTADDLDILFKLYEKMPTRSFVCDALDFLNARFINKVDMVKIANSNLGISLLFQATYTPAWLKPEKYIPFIEYLASVMENKVDKIYLLSQFNEVLFLEACKTVSNTLFAKTVKVIMHKKKQNLLSETGLGQLKDVKPKLHEIYSKKLLKAA